VCSPGTAANWPVCLPVPEVNTLLNFTTDENMNMTEHSGLPVARTLSARLLLLLLLLVAVRHAHAIDPVRMGFVDMGRIMDETGIAKNSEAEARQVVAEARAKLEGEQQAIVKLQQDFKRDEAIMSESQREAKQQAIQSRLQAYQKMGLELQQEINIKKLQFVEVALRPVQKAITDIAREEGLNAVFDRTESALLFVDDSMDLTDRVIKRVNTSSQ
jgi:outer membrane protein